MKLKCNICGEKIKCRFDLIVEHRMKCKQETPKDSVLSAKDVAEAIGLANNFSRC